ncbi:hypothetical protein [uncultured Dokdonia sp.]|uniref:hypothetical protein n=1 Tax=uncultured Dokdonia sp. TaxID=575653 RepID=UPI002614486F|nr:hypothetical protein [uncultured Dokdonia sp.]
MSLKLYMSFIWFIGLNIYGQIDNNVLYQKVLSENSIDSIYVFGQWNKIDGIETHLKYLGMICNKNENFKIVTSSRLWGLSKRATNKILVFSEKNKYLGNYYVTMKYDLPAKIENNQIVFSPPKEANCDKDLITRISFGKGIPEQFFIECKDGKGDIYLFNKE